MEKINKLIENKEPEQLAIPLSEDQVIVRPELNTSKFADFIFPPSHGKDLKKTRIKKWRGTLPNGKDGDISLRVSPPESFKAPSHNTYKVLLVLYDLWQERHLTDGTCICSIRDILKRLGLSFGRENTKMVERELLALRETSISWEFSFMDESGKGKRLLSKNILSKLDYQNIVSPEDQFTSRVEFRFDENIQRNLEINKTRPYQLGELLAISGEIASVLYTRLDIIMAVRERPYERTSKGLFEDLELMGGEKYKYPSRRKAKLVTIIKQINGRRISTGEILVIELRKTVDGNDWKIAVTKEKPKGLSRALRPSLPIVNDKDVVAYLAEDIAAVLGDLETHRGLYERLSMHYSVDLVYRALGEFKADGGLKSTHKRRYFVAMLHRLAHESGKEWIKSCGDDCKYRNMLV